MNTDIKIAEAERIMAYTFSDKMLCAEAIQMAASPQAVLRINGQNRMVNINKRLAILGDAVSAKVLCKIWFESRDERGLPQTSVVWAESFRRKLTNANLAELGNRLNLGNVIHASGGHFENPGTNMMGTLVEALFGAVYLDGGEEALERVMEHVGIIQHMIVARRPLNSPTESVR